MTNASDIDQNGDLPQIGQRVSLRDRVYEILKERIIGGRFGAGHQLIASQLSQQLGVSRTPIREALHRLQVEGLVTVSESGISIVPDVTYENIEAATEIRELLEVFACKRAAQSITGEQIEKLRKLHRQEIENLRNCDEGVLSELNTEIHRTILDAAGNVVLMDVVGFLLTRVPSFRLFALGSRDDLKQFVEDHGRIIEALAMSDGDQAARVMSGHIHRAHQLLLDAMPE